MREVNLKYLSVIFFVLITIKGMPCQCTPLSKLNEQEYNRAQEIFIGEVISVSVFSSLELEITFLVEENLKQTELKKEIKVRTNRGGGAACALPVRKGERWYIFPRSTNKVYLKVAV